jgi:hypothetical protein
LSEHAGEIDGCNQLLGSHGANAISGAQEVRFIPVHEIGDVLGFLFKSRRHIEFAIGDFVEHLHVAGGEMPGKFPSGA